MRTPADSVIFRLLSVLVLVLTLNACAGDDDKDKLAPEEPVGKLYNKAADLMDNGDYKDAAKAFQEVERQHPYSQWATKAQLMEAYSNYLDLDYDAAASTLEEFIQLHPGNSDIGYAYYLRGLCYYERITDVQRDQGYARDALRALQDVVNRFPDSTYARDATLKIALVNDHMAGAEMNVGRYYLKQKIYTAAIGRFKTVVEKFQTTSHVPEALERLVECYLALGITKEAKATAAVLGYNFPGSKWYQDAYNLLAEKKLAPEDDKESWIGRTWHSIF